MTNKYALLHLFSLFIAIAVQAQIPESLYRKVQGFGIGLPQEKVYLHMDNTCYFIGDTIWYQNPLRGTPHTGRLSRGKAATGDAGRHGTRGVRPEGLALRRILRTTGLHPMDAQLRTVRTSPFRMGGKRVLQHPNGQGLLPRL